ncbi:MAG: ATP-binding cassette domain-containing protein [Acutalibacteraceae bacterium]
MKINTILNGMGFAGRDRETLISALSGGEKTRLALCKLLLEEPELLILDEPTNHLDFKTLIWLEDYLKRYKGALLIVSHDRYFLDSLVTSVCELDRTRLTRYPGNYTKFTQLREEAYTRQLKLYERQQEEISPSAGVCGQEHRPGHLRQERQEQAQGHRTHGAGGKAAAAPEAGESLLQL